MDKEIKELLSGIITAQNIANNGNLNKEGIDYICASATHKIFISFLKNINIIITEIVQGLKIAHDQIKVGNIESTEAILCLIHKLEKQVNKSKKIINKGS